MRHCAWRRSFFREACGVQARLNHPQDGVARNHADDVALLENGHLVDVLGLHALENAHDRLGRRDPVDAVQRNHGGLDGSVGPFVARDALDLMQSDEADGHAVAGDDVAAAAGAQNFLDIIFEGNIARDGGHVGGHDVAGTETGEGVADGNLVVGFLRGREGTSR